MVTSAQLEQLVGERAARKAKRQLEPKAKRARVQVETDADGMNKTERAYAEQLELARLAGDVHRWRFEPVTFRLANRCGYTPDFEVVRPDGRLEYHEVKGFWREDARVKIKVAARQFDDRRFLAVQRRSKKDGGGWSVEEINP